MRQKCSRYGPSNCARLSFKEFLESESCTSMCNESLWAPLAGLLTPPMGGHNETPIRPQRDSDSATTRLRFGASNLICSRLSARWLIITSRPSRLRAPFCRSHELMGPLSFEHRPPNVRGGRASRLAAWAWERHFDCTTPEDGGWTPSRSTHGSGDVSRLSGRRTHPKWYWVWIGRTRDCKRLQSSSF